MRRIINNLTGLLFGLIIGAVLMLSLVPRAHSAEPTHDVLKAAEPDMPAPPLASMGVMQCGKPVVIWVVLANHHTLRFDKDHKPDSEAAVQAFLLWLGTGPSDIYVMPCMTST